MATRSVRVGERVLLAADDDVPYLHMIATLDSARYSCVGESGGRRCLSNQRVGDMALLPVAVR